MDPNYVFAVVVGSIGAVSALILMIPFLKMYRSWPWDLVVLYVEPRFIEQDANRL